MILNPKNPGYYSNRSFANLKLEHLDDALCDASRAIACDKNHFKAYRRRADVNIAMRRYGNALADYESVMTMLQSKDPNAENLKYMKIAREKLVKLNKIGKGTHRGNIFISS